MGIIPPTGTMHRHVPVIMLILAIHLLMGCGTSPLARYPDFPLKKSQAASTIVLSDVVIIDELIGDTAKVDIIENTKLSKTCLNMLAGALNDKGYHVDRTLLTSIGLAMKRERVYKIVQTPDDQQRDVELLPSAAPPFFIDQIFRNDSSMQQQLQTLYMRLLNTERKKGQPAITIPEAVSIGRKVGGGLVFVILAGGHNVPVTNQIGKYTQTQSLTFDRVTVQQITQLSVMLFVFDGLTGEILWDDHSVKKGGLIYKEKFVSMLQDILNELP